jgi:predicted metal-dependent hydrolase
MAEKEELLKRGVAEFNRGLFFECHETLEQIWLEEDGDEKDFCQGLIQIAAGYYKMEGGGLAGAIKLLSSGLGRLLPFRPAHDGIELDNFLENVEKSLRKLQGLHAAGRESGEVGVPTISLADDRSLPRQ